MRIVRAIIIENDDQTAQQFKQFETENAVLFAICDIASNFDTLTNLVNTHQPDILIISADQLFFEAKMLDQISVRKPKVISISVDKSNAYDAFKNNAIDFLLKPIDGNTLIISLYKAIKYIEMESVFQNDTLGKIKTINALQQNFDYVAIASVDRIELLKIDEIVFCKADGKYTEFYGAKNMKMVSSRNLGEYTSSLDNNFFRIHHSYIVNIRHLLKIIKKDGLYCELSNGYVLPVAKRRQEDFIKFINL